MATLLSTDELREALAGLDGWHGDGTKITRTVMLDADRIEPFLGQLRSVAREMNHDPDIDRDGETLTITMSTHSAGGVTDLDVTYARRVDEILGTPAS